MPVATDRLKQLQQELDHLSEDEWWRAEASFSEAGGLLAVNYHGYYGEEALEPVFETLCLPEVVGVLGTLSFAGGDEGANGTRNWDFSLF